MRPIKLTMSAFGPFSGIEVIEFEMLGENPLFLINGPTGSGKTTILDGICFALYGKTTGDEREAAEMRCDTAAPETLSYVELIFSLGGQIWRIRREPEQLRPKGRGEGLTAHQPRAELYSRDESGKESVRVASKVTEARAAIEELTGLNVEQFRQVMVLPQGEFRNLLMAKSSDREKVFSHLFQTQIYTRIEFALKEQAASVRKDLEASRNQQLGVLRGAGVESEEQLLTELKSQAGQMKESAGHKARASKSRKQAERALLDAQKLAADFERLGQAKAALQLQVQQCKEIDELGEQLHRARAALRLQPEFNQWQLATKLRERSEVNLRKVQGKLQACLEQSTLARDELQRLVAHEPKIESIQQHKRNLEAYRNRVGQFEAAICSLETGARKLALRKTALEECRSQWQKIQLSSNDINQQHRRILERLKGLADQQLELHRLEDSYQQRKRAEETGKKLDGCKCELRELATARDKAARQRDQADQAVARLELAWHTGQAAVLAEKLQKDQPCPVCGSFDHPQPASSELEIPGDEARREVVSCLNGAKEILLKLDTEIAGQEAHKAHLGELVEAQKTTLGDLFDQPVAELLNMLNGQLQRVQSLKDDQLKESQLADKSQRLSSELSRLQDDVKAAEQAHSEADTQHEVARSAMRQAEAELPEKYRASGKLESEISVLDSQLSTYHQQKTSATLKADEASAAFSKAEAGRDSAEQQIKETQQAEAVLNGQWQQSIANSLFQDEQGFQTARLDDEPMRALDEKIKRYFTEIDQARGAIKALQEVLIDQQEPDLGSVQRQAEEANTEFAAADASYAEIDKRLSLLQDITRELDEVKNRAQALEDKYAVIGTLADTASGKTGNRISLQRFVLSVLLDDVLTQASQRFKRMSKGRYELYRLQEKGKGGGASGLELVVDDAYSGKQRPVATLSGGESFMAALSLALGLSDVVQAYAGGIKLDTLFIDEGFGSLDSESLDLAVNTLIELQSSGRMVGVISHVPELKERINVRLDVIADRSGSYTRMALA